MADGRVSYLEAAAILAKTRGNQAESRSHHLDRIQAVWIFKPDDWYIKFYLVDGVCFISFHPAQAQA